MRQTFFEGALIRHWSISIIQSTKTLLISINILSNIFDPVNVLIGSFTVFSIIFVLTLVKTHRFFSQFTWIYDKSTSVRKLSVLCEWALICVLNFTIFPFHNSLDLSTLFESSSKFRFLFVIKLVSLSMENIVFELSWVFEIFRNVFSLFQHVIIELSIDVWSIGEYENTLTIGFAIIEMTDENRSIIFIKRTIPTWIIHLYCRNRLRNSLDLRKCHQDKIWSLFSPFAIVVKKVLFLELKSTVLFNIIFDWIA